MLDTILSDKVKRLAELPLPEYKVLCVAELPPGALVRVRTQSGNFYFFRFTEPEKCLAEVRCHSEKKKCPVAGYHGVRRISPVLEVTKAVTYGTSKTSAIKHIGIVSVQYLQ